MTSLKDLPQDNLIVLLASRFDLNEGGHFYWYTKEIVAQLNVHHPKYLILSPPISESKLPDFIDSRWQFIEDFSAWGNDIGAKSPKKLVSRIFPVLNNLDKSENTIVLSFESSFSMLVALLEIQRRIPALRVSITLLDHGFWSKFFSAKLPPVRFLVLNFLRILKNVSNSFKLLHPSLSQVESFSKLLGLNIFSFNHFSAFWKYSARPLKIDPKEIRLLVLPWRDDLDHVLDFIKSSSAKIGIAFHVHLHFKTHSDLNYFREHLAIDIFDKIQFSVGVLSLEDYISQFKRSDLAWIPYADFFHQITGSGRAFDCLALGCPLIIDEKSDLALMVSDFPLLFFYPNTDISWISKFVDLLAEEKKDFDNYVLLRSRLQELGSALFSPLNGIDSFLKRFDSKMEETKVEFSFIDFFFLEILYYFGFYYSKFNSTWNCFRELPKFLVRRYEKTKSLP